jgi:hypothetical protein
MRTRQLILLLTAVTALSGCSSGGTASGGNNFGLTGAWGGTMRSQQQNFDIPDNPATPADESGTGPYSGNVIMNIVQDVAGKITGIVTVNDPETSCWTGGTLADSSLTGNQIMLSWADQSGSTVSVQGTATGTTINALYTSSDGTCDAHSGFFNISR